MKTINQSELISMSLDPIKRAVSRWLLDMQIRSIDRHTASLQRSIDNDLGAKRVLAAERINLALRRAGLR